MPSMKIALVHELLTMKGGAERVLRIVADEMFPDAPIYTLLYDERKLGDWFPKQRVITSSVQQSLKNRLLQATSYKLQAHHAHLSRFPSAVEAFDFSQFDLVLSFSSAFAHGIITNGKPRHICYVNAPARYLWDRTHDILDRAGSGILGPLKRAYLSRTFHRLRTWDAEAAARPDRLLAASKNVQRRIELYWNRESTVVYPPIEDTNEHWSKRETPPSLSTFHFPFSITPKSYFLIVSTLVPYKRIDLAIEACNRTASPLLIAGDGPDRKRLEKLAGPTIRFLGYVEDGEKYALYAGARAVLFPGEEDFGLVPLESMACGTPVIAFRGGGALETVIEGETGALFAEPTSDALAATILSFDHNMYSREKCISHSNTFSKSSFVQHLYSIIDEEMEYGLKR